MRKDKKDIIVSAIIALVCILGAIGYLIYSTVNNLSEDIKFARMAISSFILAFFMFPVRDYIKYRNISRKV